MYVNRPTGRCTHMLCRLQPGNDLLLPYALPSFLAYLLRAQDGLLCVGPGHKAVRNQANRQDASVEEEVPAGGMSVFTHVYRDGCVHQKGRIRGVGCHVPHGDWQSPEQLGHALCSTQVVCAACRVRCGVVTRRKNKSVAPVVVAIERVV